MASCRFSGGMMIALAAALALPDPLMAQSIGIPLRDGSGQRATSRPVTAPATPQAAPPAARPRAAAPQRRSAPPRRVGGVRTPHQTDVSPFETVFVVGEKPITGYDLEQRARLIEFGAGRRVPNVEQQALKLLIEDELKLAEAKRQGIAIEPETKVKAFETVLKNNRMSEERFLGALKAAGVERRTFDRQMEADLMWGRTLRKRYGPRLNPSKDEVDAAMEARRGGGTGAKRYDVRQILVAVSPNAPEPQVKAAFEKAADAYRKATSCSQLDQIASGYSRGSGRVGLMTARQMPGPVAKIVTGLKVGEKAPRPMRSRQGYHVIMLCGIETGARQVNRQAVQARLRNQLIERFSESYLEEVRRVSFMEER